MKLRYLWRKRKSVIVTWLFSYSAVLFVPMLMSIIIYYQSSEALKSEIHRANGSLLEQVKYSIDTQVDLMKRLNTEILWNNKLQSLMYSTKTPSDAQFLAYQVVQDFQTYQTSYASIDEFYVTWEQTSSILRPGNVRDSKVAFDTIHNTGSLSYKDWLDTLTRTSSSQFLLLPHADAAAPQSSIAYVTHMPKNLQGRSTGTIVIMADTDRFQKAIESVEGFSGGQVLVVNKDKQVLLSNMPIEHNMQPLLDTITVGEDRSMSTQSINGDSELLSIPSGVSDLMYVLVIPRNVYWQKAEYVRQFTYISIFISFLGAAVLTWFFLRRNYSPIRNLVQSLSDKNAHEERTDWNELSFIQKAVINTRSEKEQIALQLQHHHNLLRSNMLSRLLKGKLDGPIPIQEAFKTFQIKFESDQFAVIMLAIENMENVYTSLSGMEIQDKRKFIQFIITNVMEELVGIRCHEGYVAEVDDMMVCLINFAENEEADYREDLQEIAAEAQKFLTRFQMNLTVSISGIHPMLSGVSQAYQEAMDAMEYKMVLGKREIIAYDDIRFESAALQKGYYYPLHVEQQIINFIKAGDFDHASQLVEEVTKRNFDKPAVSLTLARCLIFNFVGTMVKAINELGDADQSFLADNPLWMDTIIACETIQEMQEELQRLLQTVCTAAAAKVESNLSKDRAESLRKLISEVTQYIQECYHDSNLNVNTIGERFQLKASYLSKMFKNMTGEGLPDFINSLRIHEAKTLIKHKQISITEAAKMVGFNEVATFIRVFKKYEGITPGKYKEMN
ncbi:AraC family transcriptional regulator [Paenibacillus sp. H1-7]|uniref:helix-turn-helix domain-containing protein n=1 Tax=Paenibacillus sp. H1-7 TaxID=2282849 RepID=UPI001EF7975D|nr:helix-turn-helix domain-containing protein [Paenibacillus sp. H1-7]ULL14998.1 AraC family transcriptional regulator [Paenibacillus sp. H1-7]